MAFELTSSAFKEGERIPDRHTCEGEDLSPPLHWGVPPAATKSFVLIADDPDAPGGGRGSIGSSTISRSICEACPKASRPQTIGSTARCKD